MTGNHQWQRPDRTPNLARRTVLTGLSAAGAAWALSACSPGNAETGEPSPNASSTSTAPSTSPTSPTSPSSTAPPVAELPGGGTRIFPGRRMISLYGAPGSPGLGLLGEQDVAASVTRAQELAAEYESVSREPVIPAFEIIATVATSDPGPTGDYSSPVAVDTLREWVDAAAENNIYVVLDLQPGLSEFLPQAQMFEDLLSEPHVGLALDPEWRLAEGQQHMAQIGQVHAAEINDTTDWLAELVAEHHLPEKLVMLHQFQTRMIPDRDKVVDRDGLAVLVHADGNGVPSDKMKTYRTLTRDLPAHMRIGWKNFIDEDDPTYTPEQTMDVVPRPWFVSYQ